MRQVVDHLTTTPNYEIWYLESAIYTFAYIVWPQANTVCLDIGRVQVVSLETHLTKQVTKERSSVCTGGDMVKSEMFFL